MLPGIRPVDRHHPVIFVTEDMAVVHEIAPIRSPEIQARRSGTSKKVPFLVTHIENS